MLHKNIWNETLHNYFGQHLSIDKLIYRKKTERQDVLIFDNTVFGRVMALDGILQTTELDEFIYHEMMAHIPIITHGNVKKVLIIGGGDGGTLREVSRHSKIEQIQMVEIDAEIIELCKKYLPLHNAGAFNDPRYTLIIADGIDFVSNSIEKFDVIISDCTDPIGIGKNLFTSNFYAGCKRCLNQGGLFVAQNGVCFLQQNQVLSSYNKLCNYFNDVRFYHAAIPTYYGGIMTFAWASQNSKLHKIDIKDLKKRINSTQLSYRYYNAEIHKSSFALPQYLINTLSSSR